MFNIIPFRNVSWSVLCFDVNAANVLIRWNLSFFNAESLMFNIIPFRNVSWSVLCFDVNAANVFAEHSNTYQLNAAKE